jgi:thioredoxin 1
MGGRAKICKVNVDDAKDLAVRYGVKGIPALLIFKDGQVVAAVCRAAARDALVSALETALGA